jgi:hypothetical protein
MHGPRDDFKNDRNVTMIHVISHWNHGRVRSSPAETPSADLGVHLEKYLFCGHILFEYVRVLFQTRPYHFPILIKVLSIGKCFGNKERVICCQEDFGRIFLIEKADFWHLSDIRSPETLVT